MDDGEFRRVVQKTAIYLQQEGVSLTVSVDAVGGGKTFMLRPEDVEFFLRDRRSWTAKQWGVTPDDLDEWEKQHGDPLCGGVTKAGKPCRSILTSRLDPPGFVAWHRQHFCHAHS